MTEIKGEMPDETLRGVRDALKTYSTLPVMTIPHPDGINRIYYSGALAEKHLLALERILK